MRSELEVGEHPQFLDGSPVEVLRLVDDEQGAPTLRRKGGKKGFETGNQLRLAGSGGRRNAERRQDGA